MRVVFTRPPLPVWVCPELLYWLFTTFMPLRLTRCSGKEKQGGCWSRLVSLEDSRSVKPPSDLDHRSPTGTTPVILNFPPLESLSVTLKSLQSSLPFLCVAVKTPNNSWVPFCLFVFWNFRQNVANELRETLECCGKTLLLFLPVSLSCFCVCVPSSSSSCSAWLIQECDLSPK